MERGVRSVGTNDVVEQAQTLAMFILHRYIALNVMRGFFLLGLILVSLFAVLLLIEELDDVGTGSYTLGLGIQYVLLHTPKILLDFAAFIGLVGSIIALGALAGHHELIAVESVGGTPGNVTSAVVVTAVVLMLGVLAIAQFVIPLTLHKANVDKTIATEGFGDFVSQTGYWSQSKGRFLHVRDIEYGRVPTNIEIYEFNNQHELERYIFAAYADIERGNQWNLHNVQVKEMVAGRLQVHTENNMPWQSFLSAAQLGIIVSKPEALSLSDLYHFVGGLKERGEQSYRYELILWQKLMNPVAAAIMILLGMRFVFGSQRHVSMGKRITLGVLVGIAFYVLSQMIIHMGSMMQVSPVLVAVLPSVIVVGLLLAVQVISVRKTSSG